MKDILEINDINIIISIEKMEHILDLYNAGGLSKKEASKIAKKLLKKLETYEPAEEEQELFNFVKDLCISLTTIKRADSRFESHYINSLREELEKAKTM